MNTPSLPTLQTANLQNSPRAATQDEVSPAPAEVPFRQVLDKEVSHRQTAPATQDASADAAKAGTAPAPARTAGGNTSADNEKTDDPARNIDAASAHMLALVTHPGAIVTQPVTGKTADSNSRNSSNVINGSSDTTGITDTGTLFSQKDGHSNGLALLRATDQLASLQNKARGNGKQAEFTAILQNGKTAASSPGTSKDAANDKAVANTGTPTRTSAALPASLLDTAPTDAPRSDHTDNSARASAKAMSAAPAMTATTAASDMAARPADTKTEATLPAANLISGLQQSMSLIQQAAMTGQSAQRLTPAVGSPGWDQAVGQKVLWMSNGGMQSASMTLNPPDLGPLQIVLHVNNQQADATFITAQPEVRQALEAAMPKLREMMGQAGIELGQATVSTGTPNQHGAHQQPARGGSASSSLRPGADDGDGDGEIRLAVVPRPISRGGHSLVDTFA